MNRALAGCSLAVQIQAKPQHFTELLLDVVLAWVGLTASCTCSPAQV